MQLVKNISKLDSD